MGKMISFEEFRRKRCIGALMAQIGLPGFCEECGDDIAALLLTEAPVFDDLPPEHEPAEIVAFANLVAERERQKTPPVRRTAARRRIKK